MNLNHLALLLFVCCALSHAQDLEFNETQISINEHIDGTLVIPNDVNQPKLAIIIAGSGPTDRDGNQNFMQTNNLKKLAHALGKNGIASFRYDKRIVKQIRKGKVDRNIMFDHFVEDAKSVLDYFEPSEAFGSIFIIGHSQGSLVGMLAANEGADGFISLAGAGKPIDLVITEQVERTAPMFVEDTRRIFSVLKNNETTTDFPPALESLFKIENQPFISNWMSYDPAEVISDLDIPVMIVNGTKDLQVSTEEAQLLYRASNNGEMAIIENMNHVLVMVEGGDLENSKSYNEPYRKLSQELIETLVKFIGQNE